MNPAELVRLFSFLDAAAAAIVVVSYVGIGLLIEHPIGARRSVTLMMADYRREWMKQLAKRDSRIFDSQILASLRTGTSFFASTSILAIGGILTVAGNAETLGTVTGGVLADERPVEVYQLKLFAVALFLTAGFLRFVWANRLFGYCSVVMAAVPEPGEARAYHVAAQAAELNIRAAFNFNRGLRSLYFALATLTWMLGAVPLMIATAATLYTLWERDFSSNPYRILQRDEMLH